MLKVRLFEGLEVSGRCLCAVVAVHTSGPRHEFRA